MKKIGIGLVMLLLLLRSTAHSQSFSGISYDNGKIVLSLTNAYNGPFAGLPGELIVQTATNLSEPITWANLALDTDSSLSYPATNSQQYFRVAPEIPLFAFAIFYNLNLEIAIASTTAIAGPAFCNAGIWTGSSVLTFLSTVSAVGSVSNGPADPFCPGYESSGVSKYLVNGQPTSGNPPFIFPYAGANSNPSNAEALLNLPPANAAIGTPAAYILTNQIYFSNEADLFLTNSFNGTNWGSLIPKGTNMFLYYQDVANAPNYLTWITNDLYILKIGGHTNIISTDPTTGIDCITNVQYATYSFLTNVLFYDWREGWHGGAGPPKTVQAVQIDIGKFNRWLTNSSANSGSNYNAQCLFSKGHPIDSIYIYNAIPLTTTTLPAVRIVNGGMLPTASGSYGFTLATAMPLYIWGDYNASNSFGSDLGLNSDAYTEPSALMADAITVLSDGWTDPGLTKTVAGPTATSTTVNFACLEGIVPSNPNNAASDAEGYSGGLENFYRLLENWGSSSLTYNGSIVAMFPCQYATNCWQQDGGYYAAATRRWAYNTNFYNAAKMPPLTPAVINYVTP